MTNDGAGTGAHARRWAAVGRVVAAHGVMLRDGELIDDGALATLLRAAEHAAGSPVPDLPLARLVATFDERIDAVAPSGMAGIGRIGRGTSELIATVVRLSMRTDLLAIARATAAVEAALVGLAEANVVSLLPAHADGQVAQPTTIGHLLGAVIGPLGRASDRLETALALTNRSPMGAVALAATGMPVDRGRVAELLGFDGIVASGYDAVAATDHLSAAADAVAAVCVPLRRLAEDVLTWMRTEPGSFRLPDAGSVYVAELPQLRAPEALVALTAGLRRVAADAQTVRLLADALPLSPWLTAVDELVAAWDELAARAVRAFGEAQRVLDILEINRAWLANRAGKAFGTSGDLADFLILEEQIDPGAARNIAALTISRTREQGLEASGITPELIDGAAMMVIGREIKAEFEAISRYLAPRRFIERRSLPGGPAPATVRGELEGERARIAAGRARLRAVADRIEGAERALARLQGEVLGGEG